MKGNDVLNSTHKMKSFKRGMIASQAIIAVFNKKVLILKRKHPYAVTDNIIYPRLKRKLLKKREKKDIVNYYCGRLITFEDQYDFPKGRGNSFQEAIKEVKEETGYDITDAIISHKLENYYSVTYTGFDDKKYNIVMHVIFLSKLPNKTRTGEVRNYYIRWKDLNEMISLVNSLKDHDSRNKFTEYLKILKNISTYIF